MSFLARCLDKLTEWIQIANAKMCPGLVDFLDSPSNEYLMVKRLLGFPFGCLLGYSLYSAVFARMMFSEFIRYILGGISGLSLAFGFCLSIQVRCLSFITLVNFFGKHGRLFMWTLAFSFLLAGPVTNILANAREATRSLTCSRELLANQTKMKFELKVKPLRDVMKDLQKQAFGVRNTSKMLYDAFAPVRAEVVGKGEIKAMEDRVKQEDKVEGVGIDRAKIIDDKYKIKNNDTEGVKDEKLYEKKLEYRCEDVFDAAAAKCREKLRGLKEECERKTKMFSGILCAPLTLSVMCESARHLPALTGLDCSAKNVVNPGFGDTYAAADKSVNDFKKNFDVNMQYKLEEGLTDEIMATAEDVSKAIAHEFEYRQMWAEFWITLVQRMFAFLFVRVFLSANDYHKKFLSNLRFDNHYMTMYFRRIDRRRKMAGKRGVLPLKKLEAKVVTEPTNYKLNGPEIQKIIFGTFSVLLRALSFGLIFVIDYVIYDILNIIATNSHIETNISGEHIISVTVYGTGIIGNLMRTLLRAFNTKHTIKDMTSNLQCLPRPTRLPDEQIAKVFLMVLVVECFLCLESYGLRLRRLVGAFFYQKREKKRILFLYNDLLKKRKGFIKFMRKKVKSLAKEGELKLETNLIHSLIKSYPCLKCILSPFAPSRKCLICEDKKVKSHHECACGFIYCADCWDDVKRTCYACETECLSTDSSERGMISIRTEKKENNVVKRNKVKDSIIKFDDTDDSSF